MPGPLDALKKLGLNLPPAEQSAPLAPGEDMPGSGPKWLDPIIEGGLGMVGVGADTSANRAGQLVSAALPFAAAARGGLGALRSAPEALSGLSGAIPEAAQTYSAEQVLSHPSAQAMMERLHGQAAPTFKRMEAAGAFGGDRSVGGLPQLKRLGDVNPEFTAQGGESVLNAGRPKIKAVPDPVEAAYHSILARGGR